MSLLRSVAFAVAGLPGVFVFYPETNYLLAVLHVKTRFSRRTLLS